MYMFPSHILLQSTMALLVHSILRTYQHFELSSRPSSFKLESRTPSSLRTLLLKSSSLFLNHILQHHCRCCQHSHDYRWCSAHRQNRSSTPVNLGCGWHVFCWIHCRNCKWPDMYCDDILLINDRLVLLLDTSKEIKQWTWLLNVSWLLLFACKHSSPKKHSSGHC